MLTKSRVTVNLQQLEVLRRLVLDLNKTSELTDQPGRFLFLYDHNFGVGKVIETSGSDYNIWIGYRDQSMGNRKVSLVYWYEWLMNNYLPTFNYDVVETYNTAVSKDKTHPIDALVLLQPTKQLVHA